MILIVTKVFIRATQPATRRKISPCAYIYSYPAKALFLSKNCPIRIFVFNQIKMILKTEWKVSRELVLAKRHHCVFLFIGCPQGQQEHRGGYITETQQFVNTDNLTYLSQWYLLCKPNYNFSLSAFLLCDYKNYQQYI